MLVYIEAKEFAAFKAEKQRYSGTNTAQTITLFRAIMGPAGADLCAFKRDILMFLLTATYATGRQGAQIYGYQFEKGLPKHTGELICAGLNMSRPSLKKHLRELSDSSFVTIYAAKIGRTDHENDARVFEINCKKLIAEGGQKVTPRGARSYPHHISIHRIAKAIHPADGGSRVEGFDTEESGMLKEPKRGRWQPPTQTGNGEAVIAQIKAVAVAKTSARLTAAEVKKPQHLSKEEMQAVIDRAQRMYLPNSIRVLVTDKEFGFWKKRLREASPADFPEFVGWAFRYWADIATQSRKAALRRAEQGQKMQTPMPMAPTFQALVYRYPYLLKAFGNFAAERTTRDEVEDRKVKVLEARVEALQQNEKTLKRQLRTRTVSSPTEVRSTRQPASSVRRAVESELPEWESFGESHVKRA